LGHAKEHYSDPVYVNHLYQGIEYIANQVKGIDEKQAFSTNKDNDLRFP
jgi:hypothetical protein